MVFLTGGAGIRSWGMPVAVPLVAADGVRLSKTSPRVAWVAGPKRRESAPQGLGFESVATVVIGGGIC